MGNFSNFPDLKMAWCNIGGVILQNFVLLCWQVSNENEVDQKYVKSVPIIELATIKLILAEIIIYMISSILKPKG